MEECELCGEQVQEVYGISVDNVELRVCRACAKGKRIVYRSGEAARRPAKRGSQPTTQRKGKQDLEMSDDYGIRIKKAREAMKLPMKVLAEMINEKESLLIRVEAQRTLPDERLTRKLEKALGIKLEEEAQPDAGKGGGSRKEEATLGEFVE